MKKQQEPIVMAKCPKCGVEPEMQNNRQSPFMDKWLKCPQCGLEGPHDDSFYGAQVMWNDAVKG